MTEKGRIKGIGFRVLWQTGSIVLLATILAFLVNQIRFYVLSAEATDDAGKYAPLCTTWLNGGRCEQDPSEWARNGHDKNAGM